MRLVRLGTGSVRKRCPLLTAPSLSQQREGVLWTVWVGTITHIFCSARRPKNIHFATMAYYFNWSKPVCGVTCGTARLSLWTDSAFQTLNLMHELNESEFLFYFWWMNQSLSCTLLFSDVTSLSRCWWWWWWWRRSTASGTRRLDNTIHIVCAMSE